MSRLRLLAAGAATAAFALAPVAAASASEGTPADQRHDLRQAAVFVQLNGADGNRIQAYARATDGALTDAGSYATGGRGGKEVGAPVDALASQGSLQLTDDGRTLVAVNAGSDSVSTLRVGRDRLQLVSVEPSAGSFPTSVTVHDDLVYVLDAGGTGAVSGFRLHGSRLSPIPGSTRSLGLVNADVPFFLSSPSQVGFTPDGRTLVVATKANGTLVTFGVGDDGRLSTPVLTPSQGPVPFSFVFDAGGRLQVTQAGDGRNASYAVAPDHSLVPLGTSAPSGGAALCWNVRVGRYLYGANAGSGTLTSWATHDDGVATVLEPVAAATQPGVIDLAATYDGRYVYAMSAATGAVDAFRTHGDGTLTAAGTTSGLPQVGAVDGPEGIAAR